MPIKNIIFRNFYLAELTWIRSENICLNVIRILKCELLQVTAMKITHQSVVHNDVEGLQVVKQRRPTSRERYPAKGKSHLKV